MANLLEPQSILFGGWFDSNGQNLPTNSVMFGGWWDSVSQNEIIRIKKEIKFYYPERRCARVKQCYVEYRER